METPQASPVSDSSLDVIMGIVRQIQLDGIVLQNSDFPDPVLKRVGLSCISIPRLGCAARKTANGDLIEAVDSERYAMEAREFLRRNLVGRVVSFAPTFTIPNTSKEIGMMCIGQDWEMNVAAELVRRGLAAVRQQSTVDPFGRILSKIESVAKDRQINIWSANDEFVKYDPSVEADVEQILKNAKPLDAVVEYVVNACNFKVLLLPSLSHLNVSLVGVTMPTAAGGQAGIDQSESRKFVEDRLLQRDVIVYVHAVDKNRSWCYATVLCKHNNQDIGVYLLRNGFVKICRWNFKYVTEKDAYQSSEHYAKSNKLAIWRSFDQEVQPSLSKQNGHTGSSAVDNSTKSESVTTHSQNPTVVDSGTFNAVIVYTNGTEALEVFRMYDRQLIQIRLSSIRVRRIDYSSLSDSDRLSVNNLQLQVPFTIREHMRKALVGKQCTVTVDYKFTLPPSTANPSEKVKSDAKPNAVRLCCTVICNGRNIAVELVKKGYAEVITYRKDNPDRSMDYDDLARAEMEFKALNKKLTLSMLPAVNVVRLIGESAKSRSRSFIQQGNLLPAICEWIIGPTRINILVESISLLFMNLIGIQCFRTDDTNPENAVIAKDALQFMKLNFLQRNVFVRILGLNNAGTSFEGVLILKRDHKEIDAGAVLLSRGYAWIRESGFAYFSRDKSVRQVIDYYTQIQTQAKQEKRGYWGTDAWAQEELKQQEQLQQALMAEVNLAENKQEDKDSELESSIGAVRNNESDGIKTNDDRSVDAADNTLETDDSDASPYHETPPLFSYNAFLSWADKKLNIYVQDTERLEQSKDALDELSRTLNIHQQENGSNLVHQTNFAPSDQIVAVKDEDGSWSRATIKRVHDDAFTVFLIDTGCEVDGVSIDRIRELPDNCQRAKSLKPLAKLVRLAFCMRIADEFLTEAAQWKLADLSKANEEITVLVYDKKDDNVEQVVITTASGERDINKELLAEGLIALKTGLSAVPKRLRQSRIHEKYKDVEEIARIGLKGIWRYCTSIEDADEEEQ